MSVERDARNPSDGSGEGHGSLAEPVVLSWTDRWIAIDKPSGLPSRPTPRREPSALSLVEDWLPRRQQNPPAPGVVHRLDRDTSGVLLFSLGPEAHRALVRAFSERRLRKEYRAVVAGLPRPHRGLIDLPLRRNASGRVVPSKEGRPARTRYETIRRMEGVSYLHLELLTGRTHQIRVHLEARGTPVLGDRLYGGTAVPRLSPPRLCLHARRLVLPHDLLRELAPIEDRLRGEALTPNCPEGFEITAPDPRELRAYLRRLRSRGGS